MTDLEEPGFRALAQRIAGRSGLDVGFYKDRCLKRRIASRMSCAASRAFQR